MAENEVAVEGSLALKALHTEHERREIYYDLYLGIYPWETRLIRLQPGEFDEPLVASLHTATITFAEGLGVGDKARQVEFDALSYTWGSQVLSHPLICGKHVIRITANLSMALRHLRRKDFARYLWVDAICINQLNSEEKTLQVHNMQVIFMKAYRVVVWLGDAGEHTKAAIHALRAYSTDGPRSTTMDDNISFIEKVFDNSIETFRLAMLDLIMRPWLSRAWVIQEVHAARSINIYCGALVMTWHEFSFIPLCLRQCFDPGHWERPAPRPLGLSLDGQDVHHAKSPMFAIDFLVKIRSHYERDLRSHTQGYVPDLRQIKKSSRDQRPEDKISHRTRDKIAHFYNLLRSAPHLQATDPRDSIWALVGLSNVSVFYGASEEDDVSAVGLRIDYNRSVAQAFAEVTKLFLEWLDHPYLLLPCEQSRRNDLPSWTLDLPCAQLPSTAWSENGNYYITSSSMPPNPLVRKEAWDVLAMDGWHIGTICSVPEHGEGLIDWMEHNCRETLGRAWLMSYDEDPISKNVASMCPAASLRSWVIRVGDELENVLTFLDDLKRVNGETMSLGQRTLDTPLCVQDPEFASKYSENVYDHLSGHQLWGVVGVPQSNDIIVQFRAFFHPLVLRPLPGPKYHCVGRARPIQRMQWKDGTKPLISNKLEDHFCKLWEGDDRGRDPHFADDVERPEERSRILEIC